MQKLLLKSILFAALTLFCTNSFAQNESTFVEKNLPDKSNKDDKKAEPPKDKASTILGKLGFGSELSKALLDSKKATSLMFDDEESGSIDRAVESLKNNQVYTPEEKTDEGNEQLTEEEKKKKEEEAKNKQEEEAAENEKSYIYLASIIYFSPQTWSVWINDKKITSDTNKLEKELHVKSIQRDHVTMLWKLSVSKWRILSGRKAEEQTPKVNKDNQIEVEFELRPNQTFILSTNTVVEGRAVIALLKKKEEDKKAAKEAGKTNPNDVKLAPNRVQSE